MSEKSEHPALLLWYVSGEIGLRQRSEIEAHLVSCEDCASEVTALSSMYKSLNLQSRLDHVTSHDLALYEENGSSPAGQRDVVGEHLSECRDCREDLETLARVRTMEESAPMRPATQVAALQTPPRRAATSTTWSFAAAAAAATAALILVGTMIPWFPRQDTSEPGPIGVQLVVLPAPSRNVLTPTALTGPGPWVAQVILPFDALEGRYRVTIRHPGGSPLPGMQTTASIESDKTLTVLLPALPSPGRYELLVQLDAGSADPPHVYAFESHPPGTRKPSR